MRLIVSGNQDLRISFADKIRHKRALFDAETGVDNELIEATGAGFMREDEKNEYKRTHRHQYTRMMARRLPVVIAIDSPIE